MVVTCKNIPYLFEISFVNFRIKNYTDMLSQEFDKYTTTQSMRMFLIDRNRAAKYNIV